MALSNTLQNKRGRYTLPAFLSVCVLLTCVVFTAAIHRSSHAFLSLSGLPAGAKATVQIQQAGQRLTLVPAPENDALLFAAPPESTGDYKITAALQSGPNYQDLQILVGKKTVQIIASGFDPSEKITVTSNDSTILSGLHFDWSGKIELSQDLSERASVLCLTAGQDFKLCHTLPPQVRT